MRLFILFLLLSTSFFGQNTTRDTITYRKYNTLKWTDFKADAPVDSPFTASVSSGMSYKWSYSTSAGIIDFRFSIEAKLYRNLSWSVYKSGKQEVLKHEQLHFDITELFTRKFRKALEEYVVKRNIRKDVATIYEGIEKQRIEMQLLYDKETNHSINKESQLAWEKKVSKLLTEYEAFK